MNSFWEADAMLEADCIVVGAGLIGLLTALAWRDANPQARIMVLERGLLPTGASTRNAGFATFGSLTELLADSDVVGIDATAALVERRWQGLARLRARLGDAAMGLEQHGGFELLTAAQLPALEQIGTINAALRPIFNAAVFASDPAGLTQRGFGTQIEALVANPFEAQIHSGKMMRALALLAAQHGITVLTGACVEAIDDAARAVTLQVRSAALPQHVTTFVAARVALCTNAMTATLVPGVGIEAARGQILLTEPIPGLQWRGCHHFDEGFYYFRNVGERILLGGARNRDFQGERSTEIAISAPIQDALQRMLETIILPGRAVRIERRWAGLMGFTVDKQPLVQHVSPHVVIGFGCNGMGVALGADTAARTAALLA